MNWDGGAFHGAKLAAMIGDECLVYRRDNKPDIPWPDMLDLPGGGREGDETPAECALRELHEEFGLRLAIGRIHYARAYLSPDHGIMSHFLAVTITAAEVEAIVFGDEGRDWRLMKAADFVAHDEAAPRLRDRLADYLAAMPDNPVS